MDSTKTKKTYEIRVRIGGYPEVTISQQGYDRTEALSKTYRKFFDGESTVTFVACKEVRNGH